MYEADKVVLETDIAQQKVNNTQTDGKGNVTTYEYNVANKPTKKIDQGGIKTVEGKITYEPNKTETYTYYSNAQMATKTDRNGKITNYKYDIHARLLSKTIDKEEVSYSYDPNGNQVAMTDTTGTTTRIYDEQGRVISKGVPNLGATTFQYDILVNSKTIPELTSNYTIPAGSTAEKSKDPKGNETTKVSDGAGRLVFVISEGKVTSYTYDANGNRASVVYPDGKTKETYQYYKDNRLKKLTNTKADGSVMDEYSYTYDAAHNQTSKTETIKGILKGTTSYTYDSLNRLAEVLEPKKTTETSGKRTKYTYDAAGNRETEQITTSTAAGTQVTVSTYKYNEQNRLLSTTEETVDGTKKTTTYSYDPNGNMTKKSFEQTRQIDPSNPPTPKFGMYIKGQQDGATENAKPIAAGTASYEYDLWNQLVKASTGDGTSTYKYNGEGYRTEKTENGVLTRSLYEADKVVLETDKNGKETARNIYGTNLISRIVTTTENGTTQKDQYNYMYNGHADVTALLAADGTIVASYYYDAFGTVLEKNENKGINNPYRYAGYVFDNATSLYYLNARYYDSKIARFMSEDTYTGEDNDPLSLNLYTYCLNNPIVYTDPTGHHASGQRLSSNQPSSQTYNSDVAELQKKLIAIRAMSPVPQNQIGLFGPSTEKAVNDYKNKNLPSGNKGNNEGVVGDTTWAYIDRDYALMTNSRQYQNQALEQANKNTDSNFQNTLNNLKNTNSVSPKPSSPKPSSVQTSPNRGAGNTGGAMIGPAPNYQPTDTGMIMIDGKNYKIYVPGYENNTNTNLNGGSWVNTKTYTLSVYDFLLSRLFGTFGASDPQDPGIQIEPNYVYSSRNGGSKTIVDEYSQGNKALKTGYGLQLLASGIDAMGNSLESTPIQVIVQTNGGESRVIIQIGINSKILQNLAGNTLTIDNYDKDHDMRVTFDEKHADDPYTGYLSINRDQKFVFTPKVYAEDKVELGQDTFLFGWKTDVGYPDVLKRSQILDSSFHNGIIERVKKKLDKLK